MDVLSVMLRLRCQRCPWGPQMAGCYHAERYQLGASATEQNQYTVHMYVCSYTAHSTYVCPYMSTVHTVYYAYVHTCKLLHTYHSRSIQYMYVVCTYVCTSLLQQYTHMHYWMLRIPSMYVCMYIRRYRLTQTMLTNTVHTYVCTVFVPAYVHMYICRVLAKAG